MSEIHGKTSLEARATLEAEGRIFRSSHLQCIVVTPESTVLDEQVEFVALPLYDGEIGVAPGHSPMIGRLGYGELRLVVASGQSQRYYVDGGFVQVAGNVVSVLTNRATPAAAIDSQVAAEHLTEARKRKANSEELLAARDRLERQARAQLRIAQRARLSSR
jgi:F-type H+-transporting ATPase subunit epsilon